jgi:hypothetical protein
VTDNGRAEERQGSLPLFIPAPRPPTMDGFPVSRMPPRPRPAVTVGCAGCAACAAGLVDACGRLPRQRFTWGSWLLRGLAALAYGFVGGVTVPAADRHPRSS